MAISTALIAGFQSAKRLAGVSITYTRPSTGHSVTLTAVPGDSVHSVERDGTVVDEMHSRDYLVLTSELILNGSQVEPARHDTITEGSLTYSILAIGGEPHWRYTDPTQAILRIHTKEVA